jgi:RNA polymerase sigma-70 factor (ECF subfamily)
MDKQESLMKIDDKAFGQLVNRHKERIYSVVLRIVKNKEEAKDIAQEAFVKAYQNRESFRAEASFYTWVYRIAVNLALNYVNRNRDRQAESLDRVPLSSYSQDQTDKLEKKELAAAISNAIDRLPARQRTVFILRHYETKPYSEIASLLSISEGAAKSNYFQAVQKMKESLSMYLDEGRMTA